MGRDFMAHMIGLVNTKKCRFCKKEFVCLKNRRVFCSDYCRLMIFREIGRSPENIEKSRIRQKKRWDSGFFTKESIQKMIDGPKGRIKTPEEIQKAVRSHTGVKRPYMSGHNHPNWKGGLTKISKRIRYSMEGNRWRKDVLVRDNYTCQICGEKDLSKLEIHHIKSFAKYPELRLDINNGKTLCESCHWKTDNWGIKSKKVF